jgi:hypothetical protein
MTGQSSYGQRFRRTELDGIGRKAVQELTPQRKRETKRLLRKIVTFIDNQALYPRSNRVLDNVVLAHVSKSLNVA